MSGSLDQLITGLTGILNSLTLLAGYRESGRTPNEAERRTYEKYHGTAMNAMAR